MSRLRYRAWDKKNKIMHYGGFSIHATGKIHITPFVDPSDLIITQYTGLSDIDGKDIFECDILENDRTYFTVAWNDQGWWEGIEIGGKERELLWTYGGYYKIIGNMFNNPELYGGKNE